MEWEIPIYEQGKLRGHLTASRQGLHTTFRTDCPEWEAGIKKVWLKGEETSLLLGTLLPEEGHMRLERTISNAMLREKGLEHCQWSEIEEQKGQERPPKMDHVKADYSRWAPVQTFSLPGIAPELTEAIRQIRNGVWRREPEGVCICCPWKIGQRMPCMPLFCFASYSTRRGGMLSWLLDDKGKPRVQQV